MHVPAEWSNDGTERDQERCDRAVFGSGAELDLFSCRPICGDTKLSGDYGWRRRGAPEAHGAEGFDHVLYCPDGLWAGRAADIQDVRDYTTGL